MCFHKPLYFTCVSSCFQVLDANPVQSEQCTLIFHRQSLFSLQIIWKFSVWRVTLTLWWRCKEICYASCTVSLSPLATVLKIFVTDPRCSKFCTSIIASPAPSSETPTTSSRVPSVTFRLTFIKVRIVSTKNNLCQLWLLSPNTLHVVQKFASLQASSRLMVICCWSRLMTKNQFLVFCIKENVKHK